MSNVLKTLSRGGAAAAETDPNFNQTVLLLHGDGTNGAQNNTFLDSSTNNFTITRNPATGPNAPTQGTFSPFSVGAGEWSNFFDGSGDYLSIPDNAAFDFGSGSFTIEAWVYPSDVTPSKAEWIVSQWQSDTQNSWGVRIETNGELRFWYSTAGNTASNIAATTPGINENAWNHIAVVRNGNDLTIYVNGVSKATGSLSGVTLHNSTASVIVAGQANTGLNQNFTGYISNVRLVKGRAVYTSNFTPSTAPLGATSGGTNPPQGTETSLLTCQSNRFVDNGGLATKNTITRNGDVRVTPFSPFAPTAAYSAGTNGGSGYFDGNDHLLVGYNAALDITESEFTFEIWLYRTASGTQVEFVNQRASSSGWLCRINTDNTVLFAYAGAGAQQVLSVSTLQNNTWTHLAVTRSGTTMRMFINGIEDVVSTTGTDGTPSTADLYISRTYNAASGYFTGYISDLRIIKGTALYTSNFTPPTAPVTNVSNTSLLLNFTNAGIIDNTGKNNLETVGNAQIDTTTKKYGTGSLEFDGTGDWLIVPNSPDNQLGTGNFTIELWVYLSAVNTAEGFVAKGGASTGWLLSMTSSNTVRFTYTSSTITSTGTLAINTWYHIAVVREGTGTNQTKIYINGVNDGTGTVATDFNQTEVMYIGANRTGGDPLNGYIDDLRITKGVARYTANFTAPTKEFPDL
jgi:hypothetical protein